MMAVNFKKIPSDLSQKNIHCWWKGIVAQSEDIVRRPQNSKKISHLFWHLISSVKTSGWFFQLFVAFPVNLNFMNNQSQRSLTKFFISYILQLHNQQDSNLHKGGIFLGAAVTNVN